MSGDFDQVRDVFAASAPGRLLASVTAAAGTAWDTSVIGRTARSIADALKNTPPPSLLATIAAAVALAAVAQPLLIAVMPRTVAPAMPWWVFATIALFAAAAAWQAEAIVGAWQGSRLARWIRG